MATAPQSPTVTLTAEEFAQRPDPGHPEELVRGTILAMPLPGARHGRVCANLVFHLMSFAEHHDLGHVLSNNAGVVTQRGPDTVRGPDLSFYRYETLPRGALPRGYPVVPPDAVFEVISPDDRWPRVLGKVAEYLEAGIALVVVLDPDPEHLTVHVYEGDRPVSILTVDDDLAPGGPLAGFRVPVAQILA
jgi:Uma2 family endonuclease